MKSRKRLFLAVVAVAVAFGAGGYLLGQQLESPEDARAVVAAPEPSLIAVPVEAVALSNDVVVRGDAAFEGAVDLVLDATLGDGSSRVVTGRVPEIDTLIDEGDVAIEVSGRPVSKSRFQRLGFLSVEPDRLYGAATEDAIAAMYEAVGYEARSADEGEENQLEAAEKAVESARTALADANDNLSDALSPPSQVQQVSEAQQRQRLLDAIDQAQEALDEANADRPSNSLLAAIDQLTAAEAAGEGIQGANQAVAAAQQAEEQRVEQAQDALDQAKRALAEAEALDAAEDLDGTNTTNARNAVSDAEERLVDAEEALAELEEDIGVRLPVAEVVFLPDLPRTVTSVDVERGDFVSGSVMRISGTEVRITTGVSEANRPLLEVGQRVVIDSEQLGIEVEGEITELGRPHRHRRMWPTPGITCRSRRPGSTPFPRWSGAPMALPESKCSTPTTRTSLVQVTVGLQDKNRSLVEIEPISGDISAGDLVVTGIDQPVAVAATDGDEENDG
ncbi:hypothetical protein GQR58_029197 [Nymphon striatum]|nr:hypothetical protein GQR58_029197 [Nymphon striatum]